MPIRFKKGRKVRLLDLAFVELELIPKEDEIELRYPLEWEDEWKRTGVLQQWRDEFPELFDGSSGKDKANRREAFELSQLRPDVLIAKGRWSGLPNHYEIAHHAETSKTQDALTLESKSRKYSSAELSNRNVR